MSMLKCAVQGKSMSVVVMTCKASFYNDGNYVLVSGCAVRDVPMCEDCHLTYANLVGTEVLYSGVKIKC